MSEEKNVSQYSTFMVNLPSGGRLYKEDSPLRDGVVEMKYGTTKEEDILLNRSYISKNIVFDKLLESLIVTKNIDLKDLIVGDMSTLIIESKKSMYGSQSKMKVKCPSCGEEISFIFDINKLEVFTVPENIEENSFECTTSFGHTFKYHILTYGEDLDLKQSVKRKAKMIGKTNFDVAPSDRLIQVIDSIDGNDSKSFIRDFIKNGKLSSIESKELKENILGNTPDIALDQIVECSNCEFNDWIDIPLDVNFFWNTGDDKRRNSRRNI